MIRIFGDNDNDMDMLKCVGTGILMGNARNDLKERIPYVTCDNDSDGIYHALAEMEYFDRIWNIYEKYTSSNNRLCVFV